MEITLPVSKQSLEVPIISHKDGKKLDEIREKALSMGRVTDYSAETVEKVEKLMRERRAIIDAALTAHVPDLDSLPHRDVRILQEVTYMYTNGEPVAAIKNFLGTGVGATTSSEPNTAPTVSEF